MAVDIFAALDMLFRGERPEVFPSPWILQRFLASDQDFAQAAREVQDKIRGPEDTFEVWRGLVRPMGLSRAPKLTYVGPKKEKEAEGLIAAIMARKNVRRQVAEQMAELLELCGVAAQACKELGIEPPKKTK